MFLTIQTSICAGQNDDLAIVDVPPLSYLEAKGCRRREKTSQGRTGVEPVTSGFTARKLQSYTLPLSYRPVVKDLWRQVTLSDDGSLVRKRIQVPEQLSRDGPYTSIVSLVCNIWRCEMVAVGH